MGPDLLRRGESQHRLLLAKKRHLSRSGGSTQPLENAEALLPDDVLLGELRADALTVVNISEIRDRSSR
jgi:hypothetical protein